MMREHDDTVTGPAFVLTRANDDAGRASVPCPYDATLLAGGVCPKCRRTYAPSAPSAPSIEDDPTDEAVMLGEMPGGQRRRGTLEDV